MKKFLSVLLFSTVLLLSAAEMKVLTIGNSFTWSLKGVFPAIAQAQGDTLKLAFANHGGCSIQRHWQYITEEEKEPAKKYYRLDNKKAKLRELLASEKWDIITIQQVSTRSWVKGSFYPELDQLVAYVKKHAPGAKILFQQTWAYRSDSNSYKRWEKTPDEMFAGIDANYKEASKKFGFGVIPTGLAVQIATANQPEKFVPMPKEKRAAVKQGKNPVEPGSFHVGLIWRKDKKTGKTVLAFDSSHLNARGRYLQACVWYGYIFGKSPLEIKYEHKGISKEDAAFLRKCADQALKQAADQK